jgi:nitroreductase/NAD-dependent dihydropyrimidine dehydrogenase PreA subunit
MQTSKVVIDKEKCNACGECIADCPGDALAADDDGKAVQVKPETCIICGHCAAICPVGAVSIPMYNMNNFPALSPELEIRYEGLVSFLRRRRSVRRYASEEVPREVVAKLLDAARYAPSGTNRQGCGFAVVCGADAVGRISTVVVDYYAGLLKMMESYWGRRKIRMFAGERAFRSLKQYLPWFYRAVEKHEAGKDPVLHSAPLLIGIYGDKHSYTAHDDCVIAGYHLILAAETLGLGSCLNGILTGAARHSKDVAGALGVPDDKRLYMAVTFGYPLAKYHRAVDRFPPKANWIEG